MLRNTDWGAVAYLATSNYGRNTTEVWINNNSSNTTGCAGDSVFASSSSNCDNEYDTTNGVHASTTDNIYGIYDMSGGSNEYTMSNHGAISNTTYMTTMPQTRYVDIYYVGPFDIKPAGSASSSEYFYNYDICNFKLCGGQAHHETITFQSVSSGNQLWWSDYSNFVYSSYPWALRGGDYAGRHLAGLFDSDNDGGGGGSIRSFRVLQHAF
jgi:hypothetical protein